MVGENLVGQKMEKTGYQPYTIYDIGAFWQPSQKHEHVDDNEGDDNDYTCEGWTVQDEKYISAIKDDLRSIADSSDNLFCPVDLLDHTDGDVGSLASGSECGFRRVPI